MAEIASSNLLEQGRTSKPMAFETFLERVADDNWYTLQNSLLVHGLSVEKSEKRVSYDDGYKPLRHIPKPAERELMCASVIIPTMNQILSHQGRALVLKKVRPYQVYPWDVGSNLGGQKNCRLFSPDNCSIEKLLFMRAVQVDGYCNELHIPTADAKIEGIMARNFESPEGFFLYIKRSAEELLRRGGALTQEHFDIFSMGPAFVEAEYLVPWMLPCFSETPIVDAYNRPKPWHEFLTKVKKDYGDRLLFGTDEMERFTKDVLEGRLGPEQAPEIFQGPNGIFGYKFEKKPISLEHKREMKELLETLTKTFS